MMTSTKLKSIRTFCSRCGKDIFRYHDRVYANQKKIFHYECWMKEKNARSEV
jgi:hypothetical protein